MKNPAAVALGKIKTEKKSAAARANGAKGKRPDLIKWTYENGILIGEIDGKVCKKELCCSDDESIRKAKNAIRAKLRRMK